MPSPGIPCCHQFPSIIPLRFRRLVSSLRPSCTPHASSRPWGETFGHYSRLPFHNPSLSNSISWSNPIFRSPILGLGPVLQHQTPPRRHTSALQELDPLRSNCPWLDRESTSGPECHLFDRPTTPWLQTIRRSPCTFAAHHRTPSPQYSQSNKTSRLPPPHLGRSLPIPSA